MQLFALLGPIITLYSCNSLFLGPHDWRCVGLSSNTHSNINTYPPTWASCWWYWTKPWYITFINVRHCLYPLKISRANKLPYWLKMTFWNTATFRWHTIIIPFWKSASFILITHMNPDLVEGDSSPFSTNHIILFLSRPVLQCHHQRCYCFFELKQ